MSDPSPSPARGYRPIDDEISLWEVLAVLLRRKGTIIVSTILVAGLAAGIAHFRALQYTSSALFRPQGSEQSTSQIMSLASQFGVAVPGGGEEASPQFYQELLTSREILERIAVDPYDVDGAGPVLLKDLLEIEEPTEPQRDQETLKWLREEGVSVAVGRETGIVTISVQSEWPEVSQEMVDRLLVEISRFNMDTRKSQAAAEADFLESLVENAERELRVAEDSLQRFLEQNRAYDNSPVLEFRFGRMQREVTMRSTILTGLMQSQEQARVAEVRDTPVITVLQEPFFPPKHDPRRRVLAGLLGIVLGGLLGVVLAFVVEAFRRPNEGDPARADFDRAWDATKSAIPFVGS